MLSRTKSCLVLIDLQEGFRDPKWGPRNNPLLERNVARCLAAFRREKLTVVHVRHDSDEADSPLRANAKGFAFLPEVTPIQGEMIFTKSAHGAFVRTGLEAFLKDRGLLAPVFLGLTADHCVSTSVRMANDLGFQPLVIADATATFPRKSPNSRLIPADDIQEAALASLDGEFARVVNTDWIEFHLRSEK